MRIFIGRNLKYGYIIGFLVALAFAFLANRPLALQQDFVGFLLVFLGGMSVLFHALCLLDLVWGFLALVFKRNEGN